LSVLHKVAGEIPNCAAAVFIGSPSMSESLMASYSSSARRMNVHFSGRLVAGTNPLQVGNFPIVIFLRGLHIVPYNKEDKSCIFFCMYFVNINKELLEYPFFIVISVPLFTCGYQ
jgi:hypothetical protein